MENARRVTGNNIQVRGLLFRISRLSFHIILAALSENFR